MLGPFRTHAEALDRVGEVWDHANKVNPWAAFYSFGTVRMKDSYTVPGLFNKALGLEEANCLR